jgi:hypothetical protein
MVENDTTTRNYDESIDMLKNQTVCVESEPMNIGNHSREYNIVISKIMKVQKYMMEIDSTMDQTFIGTKPIMDGM